MLFTSCNLNIIEIKKKDYKCDKDYYNAILMCKGLELPKISKKDNIKKYII